MLSIYAGATAATAAMTQAFKGIGFLDRIPTRIFSCAVVVGLAANGVFDAVSTKNKADECDRKAPLAAAGCGWLRLAEGVLKLRLCAESGGAQITG